MSYIIRYSSNFKKAYKRCKKRGLDMLLLKEVIRILSEEGKGGKTKCVNTMFGWT